MRTAKALFIAIILLVIPRMAEAEGLFVADYGFSATGAIDSATAKPTAKSKADITVYFAPANWIRLRGIGEFDISDLPAFFNPHGGDARKGVITSGGVALEFTPDTPSTTKLALFSGVYGDLASDGLSREMLRRRCDNPEFYDLPFGNLFVSDTKIDETGLELAYNPGSGPLATSFCYSVNLGSADPLENTASVALAYGGALVYMNAYAGVIVQSETSMSLQFRGGLTALMTAPSGNELYVFVGMNRFSPTNMQEAGKKLYLMFEPRLHFGLADLSLSFFSSPVSLEDTPTYNGNYIGSNILVAFGNLNREGMRGGLSVMGMFNPEKPGTLTPFTCSITPFYTMKVSETSLQLAAVLNPFALQNIGNAIELRISIKAVY